MKAISVVAVSLFCCFISQVSYANELVIVANTAEQEIKLSKQQLRNLFMGGAIQGKYIPVSMKPSQRARIIFNTRIIGLTESRIQSYWAQLKFTGRSKPPIEFSTVEELIAYTAKTPGAITYLPSDVAIPDSLQVIFSVPE
jgi:hypothetical protein